MLLSSDQLQTAVLGLSASSLTQFLGRAYTAYKAHKDDVSGFWGTLLKNGGIVGIFRSFFMGSSSAVATPTPSSLVPRLALLLLFLTPFVVGIQGCASTPVGKAYQVERATQVGVEAVMTAWGQWVSLQQAQGHPVAEATEEKVMNAYIRYQIAATTAESATHLVAQYAGTNSSPSIISQITASQSAASVALSDLTSLVRSFGAKI